MNVFPSILVAFALAAACKSTPPTEEGADFLSEPAAPKDTGPVVFRGAGEHLPRGDEVAGWKRKEGPSYFDTGTLYEVINGASAGYLAHGFKEMAKIDYRPDGIEFKEDIVVESYRMTSPLAAYGKFSEERASCDESPSQDDLPGCSRGSDHIFHKGSFFVRVTTYDDSPAAVTQLARFATTFAKKIPGTIAVPPGAKRLPQTSQKPNSLVHHPKNLLGISALGSGFQADYQRGEAEYSLFFKEHVDAGAASETLGRFRRAAAVDGFAKEGTKPQPVQGLGEDGLVVDTAAGWVVVARSGKIVVGAVELPSADFANKEMLGILRTEADGPK